MKRLRRLVLLTLAMASAAHAESAVSREYALKAAFLYNFLRFVEWPDSAGVRPTVCIVGSGDAAAAVDRELQSKQVDGKAVVVRILSEPGDASRCALVFVPDASLGAWPAVRERLACAPVLTVGEGRAFLASGGSISIFPEANRLRFDVNRGPASCTGLRFSSRLLSLARAVDGRVAER
jgi:hypothetical protein